MSRSVTLHGNPLSLHGPELQKGDRAPDATLRKDLGADFQLNELRNKPRVYSVVPSLDTPVCALQTQRLNKEAGSTSGVFWYTISCDLPVAMARFCKHEGIDAQEFNVLSDHKYLEFGENYGTLLPDLRILCRAVFVIDKNDTIVYAEYVPEISNQPNYEKVMESVTEILSQ